MFVVPVPVSVEPFFGRRRAFKIPLAPTRGPNCRSSVAKSSLGAVKIKNKNFRLRSQPIYVVKLWAFPAPQPRYQSRWMFVGCKLINFCCSKILEMENKMEETEGSGLVPYLSSPQIRNQSPSQSWLIKIMFYTDLRWVDQILTVN